MKPKIGDYILIIAVIALCAVIIVPKKASGDTAAVYCDGQKLASLSLSHDCEFPVTGAYHALVVVKDGKVYIKSADCPDKICVKSGEISKSGQLICCLPNRLIVKIESDSEATDVIAG